MAITDERPKFVPLPPPTPIAVATAIPAGEASPAVVSAPGISWPSVLAIAGLGTTQIIGWGSAFTPLMVFGARFAEDLAVPREVAFAGISVMLIVSAFVAPRVGRAVSRHGARPVMMAGSCIMAAAMLGMALSTGLFTYALAWVVVGIGMPMALNNTAMPGLVEVVGRNARRAITALTLMSGLTSTVFLPLITGLDGRFGWRGAYLVFALLNLLICLPIHASVLARRDPRAAGLPAGVGPSALKPADGSPAVRPSGLTTFQNGSLAAEHRYFAFAMIALWSCTEGMLTWGLNLQIIDVLKGLGMTQAAAIGVWLLTGPAQASARFVDLVLGNRFDILHAAFMAAALAPIGFLLLVLLGASPWTAACFCVLFGIAHGFYAIARNTLPLMLFGQRDYAVYMARLSVPQNAANAIAPVLFASILAHVGPQVALWLAAASATAGFAAVAMLVRHCRRTSVASPAVAPA